MNVQTVVDGDHASLTIEGRLSVTTSPDLEAEIEKLPATVSNIDFYLADLEYISSAGLRVLVTTQKIVTQRGGTMVLFCTLASHYFPLCLDSAGRFCAGDVPHGNLGKNAG